MREAANWSTTPIRVIRDLLDQTAEHVRRDLPKIYISDVLAADIAKRQSTSVYLKALTEQGLLQDKKRWAGKSLHQSGVARASWLPAPGSAQPIKRLSCQAAPWMTLDAGT